MANIFLWRLDRKAFSMTVLDDIFHAALNLTEKISQLVEKQHEVLTFYFPLSAVKNIIGIFKSNTLSVVQSWSGQRKNVLLFL
jgi:hypothetical protein